jgi:hypothetical protein
VAKRIFGSLMELMDFFQKSGAEGGKIAAQRMSKAERVARARKAAAASAKVRTAKAKEAPPVAQANPRTRRRG